MAEQILSSSLAILDALSAHIALLDESGTIVAVNRAWRRFAEANQLQDTGQGVGTNYLSFCESARGDGADQAKAVARGIREVIARQREEFSLEYPGSRPNEQHWFLVRATRFEDSESVHIIVSHENITNRRQDETERKRAEAQLRSLINTTQDAVVTINSQGRIELFNPAAEHIFGYTQAEVQGQRVELLMPEPYAGEHEGYIERYERTGEARAIGRIRTVAARRKNGEVFPIELSVAEMRTDSEIRYGALIRDTSEKIRLQEQLVERERLAAIGTTAATFAHEVGNPLNSMYMAAQLLERYCTRMKDVIDEKAVATLQNLMSEIKRLTLLLEEFRLLARRQKLNLQPTSLETLVGDFLAAETPAHATRSIRIAQQLPHNLPLVEVDSEKLRQVLLNLCKNAAEAMPQGGTLTIGAAHVGDRVRLEISDTGIGIPSGVNIFEPFITTKAQGTGLGLTIVRQIISAHGGTLTYRSEPGQGTTFTLELPVSWDRNVETEHFLK